MDNEKHIAFLLARKGNINIYLRSLAVDPKWIPLLNAELYYITIQIEFLSKYSSRDYRNVANAIMNINNEEISND